MEMNQKLRRYDRQQWKNSREIKLYLFQMMHLFDFLLQASFAGRDLTIALAPMLAQASTHHVASI